MNTVTQRSAGILLVVVLLTASTDGLWTAWDRGLVGHAPRTPLASAKEPAVGLHPNLTDRRRRAHAQFLPINIQSSGQEIHGQPDTIQWATLTTFERLYRDGKIRRQTLPAHTNRRIGSILGMTRHA